MVWLLPSCPSPLQNFLLEDLARWNSQQPPDNGNIRGWVTQLCVCVNITPLLLLYCVCVWLPFLQLSAIHKDNKRPACCHIKNKLQHMLKLLDSSNEPQWTVWRLVRQQCMTCIVRPLWRCGEVQMRAEYYLRCWALGNNQHWGGVPLS